MAGDVGFGLLVIGCGVCVCSSGIRIGREIRGRGSGGGGKRGRGGRDPRRGQAQRVRSGGGEAVLLGGLGELGAEDVGEGDDGVDQAGGLGQVRGRGAAVADGGAAVGGGVADQHGGLGEPGEGALGLAEGGVDGDGHAAGGVAVVLFLFFWLLGLWTRSE